MNTQCKPSKLLLLLLLALALLPAAIPHAWAEGSFQAVVSVDSMKVYAKEAPHGYLGALPRGTEVTVQATAGNAALISYAGRTGIAQTSDLSRAETASEATLDRAMTATRETRIYKKPSTSASYASVAAGTNVTLLALNGNCAKVRYGGKVGYMPYNHLGEPGSATVETPAAVDTTPVQTGNAPVAVSRASRVYADAALSGESVSVSKGTKLTLLAIRGDCAMVEKGGAIGYMALGDLEKSTASSSAPAKSSNPFASGSNEAVIYAFLTGEMGYNRAAAMGVVANMTYASGYRPVCDGDRGTSYGICQWHAGRKDNLINYCMENGLDVDTLEGQLQFFRYEITTRYPSVHAYLKGVENTAEGAYDAGYYFCFNYEAPAARTSQSTKRGTYARDTLFVM